MLAFFLSFFISLLGILNLIGINSRFAYRQAFSLGIALLIFFITKRFRAFFLFLLDKFFYVFLILNFYLVFFGKQIKGASRWIEVFGLRFQPSEFLIIFFILFLADLFSKKYLDLVDFWSFLKSLFILFFSFLAVYLQPDLGTALEFIFIYFLVLIFAPVQKRYLVYLFLFFFLILPLGWISLKPYQKARVISFIKKTSNYRSTNYNMKQAEIAIGSGGFLGEGLGRASQVRLAFLPEKHTDFSFSSFVSQTGFLGGALLIFLYFSLILSLFRKFHQGTFTEKKDVFLSLTTIGFIAHIFYRSFVNIGMNLGLLPIAGVPLVLFSFGGSSLVAYFFGLALLNKE